MDEEGEETAGADEEEDDQEETEEEEDESEANDDKPLMKKPCHAMETKKPAAAPKAKSAVGKGKTTTSLTKLIKINEKNPSVSTIIASGTSIYKYPKAVKFLQNAKAKAVRPPA